MNSLIHELINELKTNETVNQNLMVKMVADSIQNSSILGMEPDQVVDTALSNLGYIAEVTVNENLKEVVAKFKQIAQKPTNRLQNMAKEAGISLKVKALKESALKTDPMFNQTLKNIEKKLEIFPEFRIIGLTIEALNPFSYDHSVNEAMTSLIDYVNQNRAKIEIINSIYEMRQTGAVLYGDLIAALENCLMEELYTADAVKMKLHGKPQMPVTTRLINSLSMVEAREIGAFNIGIGNGDVQVKPVIAPFYKISESEAIAFIDNRFVKLADEVDPTELPVEELEIYPEFTEICEAFASLGFKDSSKGIIAKGRTLSLEFEVNEEESLDLKVNGMKVEDLGQVKITDLLVMENLLTRASVTKILNNLDIIVNFGFIKKLVNERLSGDSIVITFGETQFVLEKYGNGRLVKKMQGLEFHNYVMERFNYDISDLYAIELEEREQAIKDIEHNKSSIEENISKLEKSMAELDEALKDTGMDDAYLTQLNDLKVSIEKNVNALKSRYIELEVSKKKP
jgi:hypothetical protein